MLKTKNLDRDLIELDHGQSSRREIVILHDCHSAKLSLCEMSFCAIVILSWRFSAKHDRKATALRDETVSLFADYAGGGSRGRRNSLVEQPLSDAH